MRKLQSILTLSLALFIGLTASGFRLSLHYCCGQIQSISVGAEAKPCEMENKEQWQFSQDAHWLKKSQDCCESRIFQLETLQMGKKENALTLQAPTLAFLPAQILSFSQYFPSLSTLHLPDQYDPPKIVRNLLLLVQVFRL